MSCQERDAMRGMASAEGRHGLGRMGLRRAILGVVLLGLLALGVGSDVTQAHDLDARRRRHVAQGNQLAPLRGPDLNPACRQRSRERIGPMRASALRVHGRGLDGDDLLFAGLESDPCRPDRLGTRFGGPCQHNALPSAGYV